VRPRSRRGFGVIGPVGLMAVALAAVVGAFGVGAGRAGAESPVTVVVTEADLDWPEGALGSMTWTGFGGEVSEDPECVTEGISGPITSIRFELTFDLSTDPVTLTGTLAGAGEWRNATDDPAYGQEWASVSFSGPIVGGWARQTEEGWAWGGNADLTLDFAGARLCDINLDEWLEEVYQFAYGSGQRQVTVAFSGGCFDGVNHGFGLDGNSRPDGDVGEPGEDVWYLGMGCTGCDFQLPPPIGSGCHAREPVSGSGSVFGVPPWLGPGVLGGPPVGDGGQSSAQSDQENTDGEEGDVWGALFGNDDSGRRGGWSPLGVLILILLLIAVIGYAVPLAVQAVLSGLREGRDFPMHRRLSGDQVRNLVDSAQAHQARGWSRIPADVAVVRPVELRLGPGEITLGQPHRSIRAWLRPGQRYQIVGEKAIGDPQAGGELWYEVLVRDQAGWVPRSAVVSAESVPPPPPIPPPGWQVVQFPSEFRARKPDANDWVKRPPGLYRLGSTIREGLRPIYTPLGKLFGYVAPGDVPPSSSPLTKGVAPPP
jgi:hypothetical protein